VKGTRIISFGCCIIIEWIDTLDFCFTWIMTFHAPWLDLCPLCCTSGSSSSSVGYSIVNGLAALCCDSGIRRLLSTMIDIQTHGCLLGLDCGYRRMQRTPFGQGIHDFSIFMSLIINFPWFLDGQCLPGNGLVLVLVLVLIVIMLFVAAIFILEAVLDDKGAFHCRDLMSFEGSFVGFAGRTCTCRASFRGILFGFVGITTISTGGGLLFGDGLGFGCSLVDRFLLASVVSVSVPSRLLRSREVARFGFCRRAAAAAAAAVVSLSVSPSVLVKSSMVEPALMVLACHNSWSSSWSTILVLVLVLVLVVGFSFFFLTLAFLRVFC
jgi:hypothetical protein